MMGLFVEFYQNHLQEDLSSQLELECTYRIYKVWCEMQNSVVIGRKKFKAYLLEESLKANFRLAVNDLGLEVIEGMQLVFGDPPR